MRIIYLHHAQRDISNGANQENDITLNGIKEAQLLAEVGKNYNVKTIYSSPYLRCKHTAEIINKYNNVPIIEEPRFNEWNPSESWEKFLKRNISAIDDIVSSNDDEDIIVCITSGVNLSAFICYFYNIGPSNDVPKAQAIACSPISFKIDKEIL